MITQARLKQLLHYDPGTGQFTWQVSRGRAAAGSRAGTFSKGYVRISLDGKVYFGHTLAWLYMTGEFVIGLDHRDLDRSNNTIVNLRRANKSQNSCNTTLRSDNSSGFKGVTLKKSTGRWLAQIQIDGRNHHLGYYKSKHEAFKVREKAASDYHGAFARTS